MNREYPSFEVVREIEIKRIVSFFCHSNPPGFVFKGESHNFWEFVIVLDGNAVICADDKVFRVEKGQAMWHRPDEFHSVRNNGEKPLYLGVFSFYGDIKPDVSDKVYVVKKELLDMFIKLRMAAGGIFDFYGIEGERPILVRNIKQGKEVEQQRLVSKMEYILASVISDDVLSATRKPSASEENYLRIVEVISENLSSRLSIEDIAEKCNMSLSNIKRVFAKYAGCGISEYYNGLVIFEAKKMLSDGVSVCEVAKKLGFSSQNYFSSFFKRITGLSPTEYKRK